MSGITAQDSTCQRDLLIVNAASQRQRMNFEARECQVLPHKIRLTTEMDRLCKVCLTGNVELIAGGSVTCYRLRCALPVRFSGCEGYITPVT